MTRYVILDTETTSLDPKFGDLWEVATITYDTARPEDGYKESWWQVRPPLRFATPGSVQIGRYYERAVITDKQVGQGVQLACADLGMDGYGDPYQLNMHGKSAKAGDILRTWSAQTIALRLAKQLDGAIIVANNPGFDRDFIAKFLRNNGQLLTAHHRMEDIRVMLTGYVYGRLALAEGEVDEAFSPEVAQYVKDWLDGVTNVLPWEVVGVTQELATRHTALGDARLVKRVFREITSGVTR